MISVERSISKFFSPIAGAIYFAQTLTMPVQAQESGVTSSQEGSFQVQRFANYEIRKRVFCSEREYALIFVRGHHIPNEGVMMEIWNPAGEAYRARLEADPRLLPDAWSQHGLEIPTGEGYQIFLILPDRAVSFGIFDLICPTPFDLDSIS